LMRVWPYIAISLLQDGMQSRTHCWLKVVDQQGKGVQGYKCRVVEEHAPLLFFFGGKDVVRIFETGADGSFEYRSKGAAGTVFFGYDASLQWRLNPRHLMQSHYIGITSAERQQAIQDNPTAYLGSKENPYLIHVFKVGAPQRLLFWKKRVKVETIGNYLCVELLSGRTWESKEPEGDLAMADGQRGKHGEPPECFFSAVAGEYCSLCPVVDDWGLEPPDGGYVKQLCFDKDWQEKRKWTYSTIQVYYKLMRAGAGGTVYGRLTLGNSPRVNGAQIESYTNLHGERNLFYKGYTDVPYQEIRDFVSPSK